MLRPYSAISLHPSIRSVLPAIRFVRRICGRNRSLPPQKKRGVILQSRRAPGCALVQNLLSLILPRQRPLEYRRAGTPQRITLRMAMSVRHRMPIRMTGLRDVAVAIAVPRRSLRQPRGITDRAESSRDRTDVIADRLQPFQNRLPLFPIQLSQERP